MFLWAENDELKKRKLFSFDRKEAICFIFLLSTMFIIDKGLICEFVFQDGVRFYIYFDSDYELDADSVEEKNKVGINLVLSYT